MNKKNKLKILIIFIIINIFFIFNISYAKYTIVKNFNSITIKIIVVENIELQNE